MIIAREAKIDIVPNKNVPTVIHVSQYDDEACKIIFTLYNGGTAFAKPKGATAKVQITKPDKKAIESTCTYEEDGTVSVILTEQMTAKNGLARGKIVIMDSNGGQVGTAAFILDVDPAGIADDAIVSESDLPDLKEIMSSVDAVAQQVAAAEVSAKNAAASAVEASEAKEAASASAVEAGKSAQGASESQTAAAASEKNAKASETNAKNSADAASQSAKAAGTSETNATASAKAAAASETKAGESKTAAGRSAEAAATSETKAGESKTAAGRSAEAAAASEKAASESASAAADSASTAGKSASAASTSAAEAAKSAKNAADESSTVISKLQTESKAQQAAIEKKGADTLATIPDSYNEIASQIGNVKLSITDAGLLHIEKKEA